MSEASTGLSAIEFRGLVVVDEATSPLLSTVQGTRRLVDYHNAKRLTKHDTGSRISTATLSLLARDVQPHPIPLIGLVS